MILADFFATRIREDPTGSGSGSTSLSELKTSFLPPFDYHIITIYQQYGQISREKKTTFKTLGYKIYRQPLYRNKPDCLLEVSKEKCCCIVYTVLYINMNISAIIN